MQVDLWKKILSRMEDNKYTEKDSDLIKYFIKLCKDKKEIGCFYNIHDDFLFKFEKSIGTNIDISSNCVEGSIIINFMNDLVTELADLLKHKLFVDRKRIHLIIRTLHNLPRYFLDNPKTLVHDLKHMGIDFRSAIDYSFGNMDQEMKVRYEKYNIL
ncbi:UNVERIFIED_CONTAM: hypothetical protein Cloal_4323 [Acetivibrio alkalicellulosi]